jgi:hypothetical protein
MTNERLLEERLPGLGELWYWVYDITMRYEEYHDNVRSNDAGSHRISQCFSLYFSSAFNLQVASHHHSECRISDPIPISECRIQVLYCILRIPNPQISCIPRLLQETPKIQQELNPIHRCIRSYEFNIVSLDILMSSMSSGILGNSHRSEAHQPHQEKGNVLRSPSPLSNHVSSITAKYGAEPTIAPI